MPQNQPTLYTNSPETFTVNMADIAESEEAYSIPVVFTKEGVHNGALKPYEGFKTQASALVGKPVVLLHPKNGEANRPVDLNRDPVTGEVETCQARDSDRSLHGRIKLIKQKTPGWFIEALKAGHLRGGSPGYWRSAQSAGGLFEGKPYQEIETITGWDHYAIGLVDGAASVTDGVGLRFNSPDNKPADDDVPVTMGRLRQFFSDLLKKPKPSDEKPSEGQTLSEDEKKRLEKLEKQFEDLTTQKKDLDKQLEEEKKARTEAEKKLKTYTDKEAKEEQDKKEALIKEIIENTDTKAETYKDFTAAQLETVKAQLVAQQKLGDPNSQTPAGQQQPPPAADKTGMKPAPNNTQTPAAPTGPYNDQNLTIGNSLFGKKQGET